MGGQRRAGELAGAEVEDALAQLMACRRPLTEPEIALLAAVYPHLVAAHVDAVWHELRRSGVREADREDVAQETFAGFFTWFCDNGAPDSVPAKLCSMASGKAANLRRDLRGELLGLPSSGSEPARSGPDLARILDNELFRQRLRAALTPEQWDAVEAVYFQQRPQEEVAIALNIPRSTLASRLIAAKKVMAKVAEALFSGGGR